MFSYPMNFADKLAKLIDTKGISQTRLGREVGLSQSTISAMCRGDQRPYLDQAFGLARVLGVSIEFLADDSLDEPAAGLSDDEAKVLDAYRVRVGIEEPPPSGLEAARRLSRVGPGDTEPTKVVPSAVPQPPSPLPSRGKGRTK